MKVIRENQYIKCEECGKLLAKYENGWLKISGKIDYSSNGIIHKFECSKCNHITEIKILKQQC